MPTFELANEGLNEDTRIPLRWLFALGSVAGGVLLVGAGLMIWGTRLEAKGEFQESRLSKVELETEEFSRGQSTILLQLMEIKTELRYMREKK